MRALVAGAAARLVGRALRPPVGDPVRFTAAASPDSPSPSRPGPSLDAGTVGRDPGGVRAPRLASVAAGPMRSPADGPEMPAPRPEAPPSAIHAAMKVNAPSPGRAAQPAADRVPRPSPPPVTVAPARPQPQFPDPAASPGWTALAEVDRGVAPEAASTLARAMAWLAQPSDPLPAGTAPVDLAAASASTPPLSPPPCPEPSPPTPPPASLTAPAPRPTVVIDRIEIVTGARAGAPSDPLAALADRRRGASRHAGAR